MLLPSAVHVSSTFEFGAVATYPSAGGRRVTRGMRVPRKEYARSRHQRLFEENVGKTGKDAIYELLSERFGSCIYAWGRYQHPTRPPQGTAAFNRMCKHDLDFYVPFLCLYILYTLFIFFLFLWSTRVFAFAPTYSSIAMRKSNLRSSLRTEGLLIKLILSFLKDLILVVNKSHLRRWTFETIF